MLGNSGSPEAEPETSSHRAAPKHSRWVLPALLLAAAAAAAALGTKLLLSDGPHGSGWQHQIGIAYAIAGAAVVLSGITALMAYFPATSVRSIRKERHEANAVTSAGDSVLAAMQEEVDAARGARDQERARADEALQQVAALEEQLARGRRHSDAVQEVQRSYEDLAASHDTVVEGLRARHASLELDLQTARDQLVAKTAEAEGAHAEGVCKERERIRTALDTLHRTIATDLPPEVRAAVTAHLERVTDALGQPESASHSARDTSTPSPPMATPPIPWQVEGAGLAPKAGSRTRRARRLRR